MEYFSISKDIFPLLFGSNVLMMIVLTKLSMKLIETIETKIVLKYGIILQMLSAISLIVFSYESNFYPIFISMIFYVGSLGFIFGNAMALALDFFKEDTGVANSVIGITEFTIAGIIGFLASLIHTGELTPVFLMMFGTSVLAFLSLKISK